MKKICVILSHCTTKCNNRGCEALCVSVMHLLNELFTNKGIEYELLLTDSHWPESFGPKKVKITDSEEIKFDSVPYPFEISLKKNIKRLINFPRYIKNLIKYNKGDYILSIGQGDSFSDIYGKPRFDRIDKAHLAARIFNKPYGLLPQTIGPFEDPKIRKRASKSINSAKLVMARDNQSFNFAKEISKNPKIVEAIDVAFFMPYQRYWIDDKYINVGLNVSSLLWNGGYTKNNMFGLKEDYQSLIKSIINHFLAKPNVKLHLVAHNIFSEPDIENDYQVCCKIAHEYNNPNLILADSFITAIDAKNYIASLDFFMGARMHATIAAFSSNVPVVPMAYSRKFNGLFVDTLSYPHIVDMKTETIQSSLDIIEQSFNNRKILSEQISKEMDTTVMERKKVIMNQLSEFFGI